MTQRFELFDPGFSTADVEIPHLDYREGDLTLDFADWQAKPVRVVFRDVAGFQWNDEFEFHELGIRDDSSYEVHESQWLARHLRLDSIAPSHGYRHLVFCFNAAGVLEVLCAEYERVNV